MYYTDIDEGRRAKFGLVSRGFRPLAQGGQNCDFRDCATGRNPVASPFWAIIIVTIRVEDAPLPHWRVHICRLSKCGRVSPPFLLPYLVCLFLSFYTLLTRFRHYYMSIEPPMVVLAPLGVALRVVLGFGARSISGSPPSCSPHASGPGIHRTIISLWIPPIFTRLC